MCIIPGAARDPDGRLPASGGAGRRLGHATGRDSGPSGCRRPSVLAPPKSPDAEYRARPARSAPRAVARYARAEGGDGWDGWSTARGISAASAAFRVCRGSRAGTSVAEVSGAGSKGRGDLVQRRQDRFGAYRAQAEYPVRCSSPERYRPRSGPRLGASRPRRGNAESASEDCAMPVRIATRDSSGARHRGRPSDDSRAPPAATAQASAAEVRRAVSDSDGARQGSGAPVNGSAPGSSICDGATPDIASASPIPCPPAFAAEARAGRGPSKGAAPRTKSAAPDIGSPKPERCPLST